MPPHSQPPTPGPGAPVRPGLTLPRRTRPLTHNLTSLTHHGEKNSEFTPQQVQTQDCPKKTWHGSGTTSHTCFRPAFWPFCGRPAGAIALPHPLPRDGDWDPAPLQVTPGEHDFRFFRTRKADPTGGLLPFPKAPKACSGFAPRPPSYPLCPAAAPQGEPRPPTQCSRPFPPTSPCCPHPTGTSTLQPGSSLHPDAGGLGPSAARVGVHPQSSDQIQMPSIQHETFSLKP